MAVGRFLKNMIGSVYRGGQHFTDSISGGIAPRKARRISRIADLLGGSALTYLGATGALSNALVVAAVATSVSAGAMAAPAAALTIGVAALFGTLNVLTTTFGLGLLSAASRKMGLPTPRQATGRVAYETARPLKWTARKLRQPFQKAHAVKRAPKRKPRAPVVKPGGYNI